jgi:hypothetical protein
MANMIKLLLVVFAIHLTLVITGVADIPMSSLYQFITNPTGWETTDFLGLFSDLFLSVGVGALIIAGTVVTRSDIFLFAGIAAVFLSFGAPLAELWTIITSQVNWIIATVLVGPLLIIYIVTVVMWWRNRA